MRSIRYLIFLKYNYMANRIFATVEGRVLESNIDTIKTETGEKSSRVLSVHQKGSRQMIQIKVPLTNDTDFEIDEVYTFNVLISDWAMNGRSGLSCVLLDNK